MEQFDTFTSHLRRRFDKWVDDSLVCELEDAWDKGNFAKAFSVGAVMCHKIPERFKTEQFRDGIRLLTRMESKSKKPEIYGRMQIRLKSKEHMTRTEAPEQGKRWSDQHDQPTSVGYYFSVLISGMKDENLPYLQSVLDMETSVPYHRQLKDIAMLAKTLYTKISHFEDKLKDVRLTVKGLAHGIHTVYEERSSVWRDCSSVSRISRILRNVKSDIDVVAEEWYMCRTNAASCLRWVARVARQIKTSGQIPRISDDVNFNEDENKLYNIAFELLSELYTSFSYRDLEGTHFALSNENKTLKENIGELENEMAKLTQYYRDLEGTYFALRNENKTLKENIGELENEMAKLTQYVNSITSYLEDLKIKETHMHRVASTLKSTNDDLSQQNSYLAGRLHLCEGQLQNAEASAICDKSRLKEKEQLQTMIHDLQERMTTLKGQKDAKDAQLKKAVKKMVDSETKYEELLSKIVQREQHIEYLTIELNKVERERDSITDRKDNLDEEMKQLKRDLRRDHTGRESNKRKGEEGMEGIQKLETENKNLNERNQDLEREVAELKQQKDGLWELTVKQRQHSESEKFKQLKEEIEKVKREKEELLNRLNQNQHETKTIQELEIKISFANEEIGQLKYRNGDLILEIEQLKQALQKEKTGRKDDEKRRRESDTQHLQFLEDRIKQLQKEKEEMSNRHENESKRVRELGDKVRRLEREKGLMPESAWNRKQYERNNDKEMKERIRQLESEQQELVNRQEQDKQHLEAKIKQLQREKEGLVHSQEIEKRNATEREERVKRLEKEKKEIENRLTEAQQYTKTIEQLEAQLKSAENEKSQLQNRASSRQHQDNPNTEELEGKIRRLELEKQEMTKRLTETQQYTRKIEQLEAQLVTVGNENTRLRNRLIESQEHEKTIEQLEAKLKAVENEKRQMQDGSLSRQHHDRNKAKELEDRVKQLAREKQEIMAKRSEETQHHAKAIEQLEAKLASAENEKWQLQSGQKYERNKTKELEDRVRQLETEKKEIAKSRGESERRLAESEQMLQSALSQQDNLQKQLEVEEIKRQQLEQTSASRSNEDSTHKLKKQLDARDREVHNLKQEVKKIKDEKDDLQNRFSKVAAAQLTHENPNIADLSDKHRPTKLGEIYSELYDNEWTEAFSQIEDDSSAASEEGIVKRLMDILVSSYDHCETVSNTQMNGLKALLFSPNTESLKRSVRQDLSAEQSRAVVDLRKQTSNAAIETIKKEITSKYSDSRRYPALKSYIEKCAELCWLMVVQSPTVYIDDKSKPGDRFDKDVFKAYTRSGPTIDFVVWPPIYLHQGGPLLCKGTAQGK